MKHTSHNYLPLTLLAIVAIGGCSSDLRRFDTPDAGSVDAGRVADVGSRVDAGAIDSAAVDVVTTDRPSVNDVGTPPPLSFVVTPYARVPTSWRVGGAWVFSAPLGTMADDYSSFSGVLDTVLAPAHRYSLRDDVIAHAAAHVGPYSGEVERALRGLERPPGSVFRARDFTAPQGMYTLLLFEATDAAPRAASQDGDNQRVIETALFPFNVRSAMYREGMRFDAGLATLEVPASGVERTAPPTHFFNIIATSSELVGPGTPLAGSYTQRHGISDADGAGYDVEISYSIVCDDADWRDTPSRCGAVATP